MLLASAMRRSPSDIWFIFVLAVELGANDQLLFDEFNDKMCDQADDDDAVRQNIREISRRLTSTRQLSSDNVEASDPSGAHYSPSMADLSLEQEAVARIIADAVEENSKYLMFVQGSAGPAKHTLFE
jgi:hypothetical protein